MNTAKYQWHDDDDDPDDDQTSKTRQSLTADNNTN